MYISFNVENGLTVVLLIAAIVVCVFMTILLSRLIGTVDQVNDLLEETKETIDDAKTKVTKTVDTVKNAGEKVTHLVSTGGNAVKTVVEKIPFLK